MKQVKLCIIGGGVMGVSLLYHLAKEGWKDIMLVEKGELTSGSTWHAAGQCPNFVGSLSLGYIHHYGTHFYPDLEKEIGATIGWHGCGGVRLAITDEEVNWFKYVQGMSKMIGYDMSLISPSEIAQVHPFLDLKGVKMGAYTHNDGHIDPTSLTNALAKLAKEMGAQIERQCLVEDIKRVKDKWQVHTSKMTIEAEIVVNAAGCYGDKIMRMVGKRAPISNMRHQYLVTEAIDELIAWNKESGKELPVVRDPYTHGYLRQEGQGLLVGPYEKSNAKICFQETDGVPLDSFDMGLFDADFDPLLDQLEKAGERLPMFAGAGIKRVINGPITHTPDGNFLLGPAAGLDNFWMCCGASIGICQGGGAGKYLAQWMTYGQAEINMRSFDPRRFGDWAIGQYTDAKSIDDYEHMYYLPCPGEYLDAGRPVRTTPMYEIEKSKGAVFAENNGHERAKWFNPEKSGENYSFKRNNSFANVAKEVEATRTRVGIMNLSAFSKFLVKGEGAAKFMDYLTANKLSKIGGITLSHILTEGGGVYESEFTITRLGEDEFYLSSGAGDRHRDFDLLTKANQSDSIKITDITEDYGVLVVAGPSSRDVLRKICQNSLTYPWLTYQTIDFAGISAFALRINYVGELGWELHVPVAQIGDLYHKIWQAGTEFGIADVGLYAINSMRMEKSYRGLGSELTNELTPIEANMERFVDYTKEFRGKKALMALKASGKVRYKLTCLEISNGDNEVLGNEPVFHNGIRVGVTTSGAYAHHGKKSLAFAYIKPELCVKGLKFTIPMLGVVRNAVAIDESPYDAKNTRLRA